MERPRNDPEALGRLQNDLDAFMGSGPSDEAIDGLERLLTSERTRPVATPPPALGIDEMDERFALGRKIQDAVEAKGGMDEVLRPAFWSLVMVSPLDGLREFVSDFCRPNRFTLIGMTREGLETLLKTCLCPVPEELGISNKVLTTNAFLIVFAKEGEVDPKPYPPRYASEAEKASCGISTHKDARVKKVHS